MSEAAEADAEGYTPRSSQSGGRGITLYARGEAVALSYQTSAGGRSVYLGKDILGSVRSATSDGGVLEVRYEYDAFGTPYQGDLSGGMNLGYTGKPYDTATGLYNYGFRDYQSIAARFTTEDPIRDGNNWFAYVNNDPVNYVDLWGLEGNVLIINMPGMTDGRLEGYLFLSESGLYNDPDLIGVKSVDNGKQLESVLNEYKNQMDTLIFAGGHSDEFFNPKDFKVDLPDTTNAYFATCEEGLNKQGIANSLGLPNSNVHFNSGQSWANNTFDFINDTIYNNIPPSEAYQKYRDANKDYQLNPQHRMDWSTEEGGRNLCGE
jgi:RHS repeat-associated protein